MAGIIPAPAELIVAPAGISPANGKTIPARAAPDLQGAGMDSAPEKLRPAMAELDLHLAGTDPAPAAIDPAPGKLRVTLARMDLHPAATVLPVAAIAAPLAADAPAMTGNALPVSTFGARAVIARGGLISENPGTGPCRIMVGTISTPSVINPRDHLATTRGQMAMLVRPRDQSCGQQILTLQRLKCGSAFGRTDFFAPQFSVLDILKANCYSISHSPSDCNSVANHVNQGEHENQPSRSSCAADPHCLAVCLWTVRSEC